MALLLAAAQLLWGCVAPLPQTAPPRSPGAARVERMAFPPLDLQVPRLGREVERIVLENGLVLYLAEDRSLPLLQAYAVFRAGRLDEPPDRPGVAALTASQLRSGGTARLSPAALNDELEVLGASLEATATDEVISLTLTALAKDADRALELLADVIRRPAFDPAPLETAKGQTVEELRRLAEHPGRLAARELARVLYTEAHPLGRPLTTAQAAALDREDLVRHHQRFFRPNNLFLALVGDFSRAELGAKIRARFGDWPAATDLPRPPLPPVPVRFQPGVYLLPRPLPQASLTLGHFGVRRGTADREAIALMDLLLGGSGFSSRLMERVRGREGLTYGVWSTFPTNTREVALFRVGLQTKGENVPRAAGAILEEMRRLREEPVAPEELTRATEALINSFVFRFASRFGTVVRLLNLEVDGEPADTYETLLDRYRAVTPADIQRVARRYLHPEAATLLVVGAPEEFEGALVPYGPLHRLTLPDP